MTTLHLSAKAGRAYNAAFDRPRDPRSEAYKNGVRAALSFRIDGVQIPHLYQLATAEDDAYYAGMQEGHSLWRELDEQGRL